MALHSTYEVRWKNFKGFKDTGWIKIKPITILLGQNNSGKTSFIVPLLLMNQTITSIDSSTAIVVNGKMYDGGNIKELVNDYDLKKEIFFGFKYHTHEAEKKLKKVGTYAPGAFEVIFGANSNKERDIIIKKESVYDIFNREFFSLKRSDLGKYELNGGDFQKISDNEKEAISNSSPLNFLFSPNSILSAHRKGQSKIDESSNTKRFTADFQKLIQSVSYNFSIVSDILGDISYLGPIRDNPHRYYDVGDENYNTVGLKGENTANLLKKHIKEIQKDLNEWVKKFGFGDEVKFEKLSDTLYSIVFKDNKNKTFTNIANAGFGHLKFCR